MASLWDNVSNDLSKVRQWAAVDICGDSIPRKGKSKFKGRTVLGLPQGKQGAQCAWSWGKWDWGRCTGEVKPATRSQIVSVSPLEGLGEGLELGIIMWLRYVSRPRIRQPRSWDHGNSNRVWEVFGVTVHMTTEPTPHAGGLCWEVSLQYSLIVLFLLLGCKQSRVHLSFYIQKGW